MKLTFDPNQCQYLHRLVQALAKMPEEPEISRVAHKLRYKFTPSQSPTLAYLNGRDRALLISLMQYRIERITELSNEYPVVSGILTKLRGQA